jgi:reverse gyrase
MFRGDKYVMLFLRCKWCGGHLKSERARETNICDTCERKRQKLKNKTKWKKAPIWKKVWWKISKNEVVANT